MTTTQKKAKPAADAGKTAVERALEKAAARGARSGRTEVVPVRLDPRLRYIAELAARTERRSLSSYIERATERAINAVVLSDGKRLGMPDVTLGQVADMLWDTNPQERLARLGLMYPHLLTYDEQLAYRELQADEAWQTARMKKQWGDEVDMTTFVTAFSEQPEKVRLIEEIFASHGIRAKYPAGKGGKRG